MIICHKYQFIFLRVPKSASTSMHYYLGKLCGNEDIVTPINIEPPADHKPRNHEGFTNHMRAENIRKMIPSKVWQNYFKFCFERNPFDKMVSVFMHRKARRPNYKKSFYEYCLERKSGRKKFPESSEIYSINENIAVDFIGRFENLEEDWNYIKSKLNLLNLGPLTKEKGNIRKDEVNYSTFCDPKSKKIIEDHFWREMKWLNYKF